MSKNSKELLDKIIAGTVYMIISTVCEDGSPWITPVYTAYDDEYNFFWSSHLDSVHSKNIARDSKVMIVIYDSQSSEGKGIYMQGSAGVIDPSELEHAMQVYGKRRGRPFKNPGLFQEGGPQRFYKFVTEKMWTNDADQDENGDFIKDYRLEIQFRSNYYFTHAVLPKLLDFGVEGIGFFADRI